MFNFLKAYCEQSESTEVNYDLITQITLQHQQTDDRCHQFHSQNLCICFMNKHKSECKENLLY